MPICHSFLCPMMLTLSPQENERQLNRKNIYIMKLKKMNWGQALAMGTVSLGFVQALQAATVLNGAGLGTTDLPTDHGSNVTGTPNVSLTWDSEWDSYTGWPNDPGNDVYQMDRQLDDAQTIIFTPSAGFDVSLGSLDLNVWVGGGATDVDWQIVGSVSGVLGGGSFNQADGSVGTHNFNISGSGSENLTLSLTQKTGAHSYLAVDNLSFDQVASVPEPSSAMLAAAGLGAMAMRRRRK